MSAYIIDCHDPELLFQAANGTRFRCFYVAQGDAASPQTSQHRIIVCVQPDQTAHLIKVDSPTTETDRSSSYQPSTRSNCGILKTTWASLLSLAWEELQNEPVAAVYVLDDDCDAEWSAALHEHQFVLDGAIQLFRRPPSESQQPLEAQQLTTPQRRVDWIKAARLFGTDELFPKIKFGEPQQQHVSQDTDYQSSIVAQLHLLLSDTLRNSQDFLPRQNVRPEEFLAMFACSPNDLSILLVSGTAGVLGVLVGDDSHGPNRGHIEYVGVHSSARRQSIATMLAHQFQARITDSALSSAIHVRNEPSLCFFLKQNFSRSEQYRLWTRDIT